MVDGGSVILNASSTASTGTPAFSVYSASKAAVQSFARTWILDLRDRGIRVNAVSPGATWTPGLSALGRSEEEKAKIKAGLLAATPLGRLGDPDETAKAITFLASDDSS